MSAPTGVHASVLELLTRCVDALGSALLLIRRLVQSPASLRRRMKGPASTAMVLFNRYFIRHSFARHSRVVSDVFEPLRRPTAGELVRGLNFESRPSSLPPMRLPMQKVATACAFMGLKVEEMHQKVRHVINNSYEVYHRKPRMNQDGPEFLEWRQHTLETERSLLFTLEFDVSVDHPYLQIKNSLNSWKEQGLFGSMFPKGTKWSEAPWKMQQILHQANNIAFTW